MKSLVLVILLFPACYIFAQNLEIPAYDEDAVVLRYSGFVLEYSDEHEQAAWVAYQLTDDEVAGTIERTDNFRADGNIPTQSASLADYRGSGFDRGHLAPAADMKWADEAMSKSFLMSNMSPQRPGFNRGKWRSLESLVRKWATKNEKIYVVTGPILTDGPYETIGENEVAIPKWYFKVILDYSVPGLKAIACILPNRKSSLPLSSFVVSVDLVEILTGIDFFPKVPDREEESIESFANWQHW